MGSDAIDGKPIESGGGLLVVAISRALQVVMKNFAVLRACEMINGWLERVVSERRFGRDDKRRVKSMQLGVAEEDGSDLGWCVKHKGVVKVSHWCVDADGLSEGVARKVAAGQNLAAELGEL